MRDQSPKKPLFPFCGVNLFLDVSHRECQIGWMNSDRAEVVAGHACETTVHLFDEVRAKFELPFKTLARKRYAPAWRGGFFEIFAIGRADGETQSASDAIQVLAFPGLYDIQDYLSFLIGIIIAIGLRFLQLIPIPAAGTHSFHLFLHYRKRQKRVWHD